MLPPVRMLLLLLLLLLLLALLLLAGLLLAAPVSKVPVLPQQQHITTATSTCRPRIADSEQLRLVDNHCAPGASIRPKGQGP